MTDILVTEDIAGPALESLRERYAVRVEKDAWRQPDRLTEAVRASRALIVRNQTRVTAELLARADRLEVIGRAGAGLDNIDVGAATAAGIRVCYAPEQNALSVAELGMGMMLALARRLVPAAGSTARGEWDRRRFTGVELYGRTLGVVGFGRIGFLLAMRARAFGMRIVAHDPFLGPDAVTVVEAGAELVPLDTLLETADIVSCHLPSTPETTRLFDAERFERMRPAALFLNLARGDVVDEDALVAALRSGAIAGAGLDVRASEPPDPSPLDEMENVIQTPHIAAFTDAAQDRVLAAVCRDIDRALQGESCRYPVNDPGVEVRA